MKTLYILRHGKSSWVDKNIADADRTLDARGERAARHMGRTFARFGWQPALALVSPALRTRRTWEIVAAAMAGAGAPAPDAKFLPELYLAPPADITAAVARHAGAAASVMVIGHNPGLHELARSFARGGTGLARERLAAGFPTCAVARVALDCQSWREAPDAAATVTDVLTPKILRQS